MLQIQISLAETDFFFLEIEQLMDDIIEKYRSSERILVLVTRTLVRRHPQLSICLSCQGKYLPVLWRNTIRKTDGGRVHFVIVLERGRKHEDGLVTLHLHSGSLQGEISHSNHTCVLETACTVLTTTQLMTKRAKRPTPLCLCSTDTSRMRNNLS